MTTQTFHQRLTRSPIAKAKMLIRRPVADVFEAIVDPRITSRFWFTKGSGKLEPGKRVQWDWEMYGVSAKVSVKDVDENRRIAFDWGDDEETTTVEFRFVPLGDDTTYLQVTETGLSGDGDALVARVAGSTGGFTIALCALKALLEHDVVLTVVRDRFPKGLDADVS